MYLKIFLVTGILYGLSIGILAGFETGVESGIKSGASSGFIFGLFMSLILGTIHKLKTRKMAKAGDVTPTQSATIELGCNLALAFDKCIQALNQFGAKIELQDKVKSEIKATSGMTWRSWGEVLTVRLSRIDTEKVKIEISSSPKLKMTLVDYGKGRENVEKITKILTSDNS
jgi:hypothetical protein